MATYFLFTPPKAPKICSSETKNMIILQIEDKEGEKNSNMSDKKH